ncbi:TM0106 family RecB-like putative nuclease [Agromyces albus]|uniref:TM0106 family RecB-like putative nuclease n=1 Tax=Agromyces albus TaxID=205332 RepID=UPI002780AE6D|nr:bifunctional RecB family nuclease/DEAD/DEAH box helicase [Agromyces albus]MDQ0576774.1 putative RecB family nuclease [Agromyces albus]
MYLVDGTVVTSASDLKKASECEFAFLRALDAKLGRIDPVPDPEDAMLERSGRMGDAHEHRVLEAYRAELGAAVVEIERPDVRDAAAVAAAVEATQAAFAAGAPIVFQATFADEGFIGFADFIVRQPDGRYLVQDSKLARRARVTALLQLAAYAEQLERTGVPCADTVELLLGDGTTSVHRLDDIAPVYRLRRARLEQIIADRLAEPGPVQWGDPRYALDGRCPTCDLEVQAHRDVLLVAGLRVTQRAALFDVGITTIDELAASEGHIDGILDATIENHRVQARLQLEAEAAERRADAAGPRPEGAPPLPPPVVVRDAASLAAIPEPDAGDLFFDFEGDPLYTEGPATEWGIDYLFGMIDNDEQFTPLWAHSFAEERVALERFLELVALRRAAHPGMHIYHYASYERTHLLSIAARHGVGEAAVDQLLADGVLVDLYPIVKRAVRVGSRSYSIKKLEPLYMGSELREAEVKSGGDSILEYVRARELAATGEVDPATGLAGTAAAQHVLDDLADYNRYDCVSTLRLRDWLLGLARAAGVEPVPESLLVEAARASGKIYEPSPLALELQRIAGPPDDPTRDADHTALALAAAAIDYHDRESKSFWWSHFFRIEQPLEAWEDHRDVLVVDPAQSEVVQRWYREDQHRTDRRHVKLRGRIAPGSRFGVGAELFALYEPPVPFPRIGLRPGSRGQNSVRVLELLDDGLIVEERAIAGMTWSELPMAIVPGTPPPAGRQQGAILEWAGLIERMHPVWPRNPAVDVLRRTHPRSRGGLAPLAAAPDYVAAVVDSLGRLDDSYLAVQGPPGTGKTYVASRVIAELVGRYRWRIGVVAQSHAVVENVLDAVVAAGLAPDLVAKAPKDARAPGTHAYLAITKDGVADYSAAHQASGFVIGGTAWDFANADRVPRGSLDLLVIDEAGQFSLASTIATAVAARNLLLLGDPQQLPQVSQGNHPEPIDTSALGWIADGHDVLPPEYGYFLAESRRMHPAVAGPVSRLSYEGELRSHPVASLRSLHGVSPGLTTVPIEHAGNTTSSPEEAEAVVELVGMLLGRAWSEVIPPTGADVEVSESTGALAALESTDELPPTDVLLPTDALPTDAALPTRSRPLAQRDLIVVTPYNAQLTVVRAALDEAGYHDVPVGTVDKFQGQEAAIAIVSLAASSAAAAPRGVEFLLLKNRLNVAISRAKWAAYLIYSPGLLDALPRTPEGVAQLSAFIRLVGAGQDTSVDDAEFSGAALIRP